MACVKTKISKREFCLGDLNRSFSIKLRNITPPPDDGVDHDEVFTDFLDVHGAVETVNGVEIFDETNVLVGVVTHKFTFRFRSGVTFQEFVIFRGKRYRILDVTNVDERDEWVVIRATERGVDTVEINKA